MVDEVRGSLVERYRQMAEEMEGERMRWLEQVPAELRPMMAKVHGPMIFKMMKDAGVDEEDQWLKQRLTTGFQLVGWLDDTSLMTVPCNRPPEITVKQLKSHCTHMNT